MTETSHTHDGRTKVAVVVHQGKLLSGANLEALRKALSRRGITKPIWNDIDKAKKAPKHVEDAIEAGVEVILVWGGDGTVRRCIEAAASSDIPIGILPAGSANLLAANLSIREDLDTALDVALRGSVLTIDVGVVNGRRFAVMAGSGFDALMVRDADKYKRRLGRVAYFVAAAKAIRANRVVAEITVDGDPWFTGNVSCVLLGNVGEATGGLEVVPDASTSDGLLELGVVTATSKRDWISVLAHLARGTPSRSKLMHATRGAVIEVRLERDVAWEVDGGDRKPTNKLEASAETAAIGICVP